MARKLRVQRIELNFWAAVRAIFTHSMNKGQFPLACVAAVMALIIFKTPEAKVGELLEAILRHTRQLAFLSYGLNVLLLVGWWGHARYQREIFRRKNPQSTALPPSQKPGNQIPCPRKPAG